jgi:hypothetical protein
VCVEVEENELFDFRGLRMDWYRLQVSFQEYISVKCNELHDFNFNSANIVNLVNLNTSKNRCLVYDFV